MSGTHAKVVRPTSFHRTKRWLANATDTVALARMSFRNPWHSGMGPCASSVSRRPSIVGSRSVCRPLQGVSGWGWGGGEVGGVGGRWVGWGDLLFAAQPPAAPPHLLQHLGGQAHAARVAAALAPRRRAASAAPHPADHSDCQTVRQNASTQRMQHITRYAVIIVVGKLVGPCRQLLGEALAAAPTQQQRLPKNRPTHCEAATSSYCLPH